MSLSCWPDHVIHYHFFIVYSFFILSCNMLTDSRVPVIDVNTVSKASCTFILNAHGKFINCYKKIVVDKTVFN